MARLKVANFSEYAALLEKDAQRRQETEDQQVPPGLAERTGASVYLRGNELTLEGEDPAVDRAKAMVEELSQLVVQGISIGPQTVEAVAGVLTADGRAVDVLHDVVWRHRGQRVSPKTLGQKAYVDAIRANTVTFGIGPAGTGKTYLAIALAVAALSEREVARIILTRPAVEAGERLGFLPGDLQAKVDPYLRPLFDALHDMLDADKLLNYIDTGMIDWVLEVLQMPDRLLEYFKNGVRLKLPPEDGPSLATQKPSSDDAEAALRDVLVFLRTRTGRDSHRAHSAASSGITTIGRTAIPWQRQMPGAPRRPLVSSTGPAIRNRRPRIRAVLLTMEFCATPVCSVRCWAPRRGPTVRTRSFRAVPGIRTGQDLIRPVL